VLGTLVIQGVTLEPLIRYLRFPPDTSRNEERARVRLQLAEAAAAELDGRDDAAARLLRDELELERTCDPRSTPELVGPVDALRLTAIRSKRAALWRMRRERLVSEDVFRAFEQELDLSEVAASRQELFDLANN
jgi:CPA1 family monovalent cation:H+ antiporter